MRLKFFILVNLIAALIFLGFIVKVRAANGDTPEPMMKITCDKFAHNGLIPTKYTCMGANINPPLTINDIPPKAQSLVLIVDDPDAPGGTWVHWVVYDMPVKTKIDENTVPGKIGINDFRDTHYGGPCPPSGKHRYCFKLFALDTKLNLPEGQKKSQVEEAMKGHVLATDELVGLYSKDATL